MKRILLTSLCIVSAVSLVRAEGIISDAMKKYHKGETAPTKKVSSGEASASEIADLLKSYEALAAAKPPKGTPASWNDKTGAVISALKGLQKDSKATGDFKKAINCKACHEVHKGK